MFKRDKIGLNTEFSFEIGHPKLKNPVFLVFIRHTSRMDQNRNLKEKRVYQEKASSYTKRLQIIIHICKPDLALNNP